MPIRLLSLQQRMLSWLLPPIMILILFWVVIANMIVLHFTNLAYDRTLEDAARTLAGQVHVANGHVEMRQPDVVRQMLEFDQVDKVFFSISDQDNRLLEGNHALPAYGERENPDTSVHFYDAKVNRQPVRVVEYKVSDDVGQARFFRVAETLRKREIMAREALTFMAVPHVVFLVIIILLVWFGVGQAVSPLNRIRDAISKRSHQDLSPMDETGLPLEAYEQVHVINELMSRLGNTIKSQKRFIADATHQLRTPITVLRTQAEMALRADSDDALKAVVAKFDSATSRLARLANQLLNLSRAEMGLEGSIQFASLVVAPIVEDVVAGLVPAALDKRSDLRVELAPDLPEIQGDRQLLSEMLANLVDNAIRYTPEGGSISITVTSEHKRILLVVLDNGPGIPECERANMLKRFYRGTDSVSEGSGLGLAIANEIVMLHRGRMALCSGQDGVGLMVKIDIPCTLVERLSI